MSHLNEQQLSAVLCEDDKILCLAGAGTGKTTSMLERISHLVETGVDPSSILVLTFTNAAAFEMKDRYKKTHSTGRIPEFRTFHSFCYWILSSNLGVRISLGYMETPTVADDNLKKSIIREAGSITNIKSSLASLSKKEHRTVKEQYEYDTLMKTIEKLMKKDNTITFDQLSIKICKLFKEDSPLVYSYKQQYKYIFVDEFQDTDPTQYEFVKSFSDSKLFVVGDALQAIYGFRGADSSIIKRLSINPDWHTIKLYQNYRSPKTICDFANKHSKHASASFRVDITSGKEQEGEPVTVRKLEDSMKFDLYPQSTAYCILDVKGHSGSTAILCRTNKEVHAIQDHFTSNGLPFRAQKKSADVANILTAVGDNQFTIDWLSSYLNAERYTDYIRVITLQPEDQPYTVLDFIRDFGTSYAVSERWNLIRTIRTICKETNRSVMDRCQDILEILDCKNLLLDASKCTTMKDAVDNILECYQGEQEEPGTDVYIGTIHSVKGLEFDNVYVFGVNGQTFRLTDEENKNLYYVAITRAKKHLVVFEKS